MQRIRSATLLVFGFLLCAGAGCATVTSGTSQSISITSNVEGADLFLDGERIGTTPYTGEVPKGRNTLRVEAEGYRSETVSLSKSLDPVFWGNIIIGGTLGSITDFATDAAYQYAPATYQVELRANDQPESDYLWQLAVRQFSILYVDEISRDLASEDRGDYLHALTALVEEHSGRAVDRTDIAQALDASRGHPVVFGNRVVDLK